MTKLHPRTLVVDAASSQLRRFLLDLQTAHDLTFVELAKITIGATEDAIKYALRKERHPRSPNKKADEA